MGGLGYMDAWFGASGWLLFAAACVCAACLGDHPAQHRAQGSLPMMGITVLVLAWRHSA